MMTSNDPTAKRTANHAACNQTESCGSNCNFHCSRSTLSNGQRGKCGCVAMTARHRRGTRHQGNQGINTHGDTNPHGKDILQNGKDGSRNRKDDDKFPTLFKGKDWLRRRLQQRKYSKRGCLRLCSRNSALPPRFHKAPGKSGK